MSDTLGQHLVSCRQRQGLTIEEIAEITRISARLIKAAEADRFEDLPGTVFIKGMLRSYAKVVGVEGSDLIKRYDSLGLVDADNSPEMINMPLYEDATGQQMMLFMAALVFAGIMFAAYFLGLFSFVTENFQGSIPAKVQTAPRVQAPKAPPAPAPAPAAVRESAVQPAKPAPEEQAKPEPAKPKPAKKEETAPQEAAKPAEEAPAESGPEPEKPTFPQAIATGDGPPYTLMINAETDSWLKVTVDSEIEKEIILREGKSVSWKAEEGFDLSIGNVAGVELYLNGKPIALEQPVSNVITNLKLPENYVGEEKTEEAQ